MSTQIAEPQAPSLKQRVARHWDEEPCGIRGIHDGDRREFFRQIERERYAQEPFIGRFAQFGASKGRRVLEIGIGAGSDYVNWLRAGANAIGIDLTWRGVQLSRERAQLEQLRPRVMQADAETLPFPDGSFDIVYSFGVIHHSPDTAKAVAEIHRVLKESGTARVMIYHAPSMVGLMLWFAHCFLRLRPWKSPSWAVEHFLESPGTKTYSRRSALRLFSAFDSVQLETVLGSGDLLLMRPSQRYRSVWARLAWSLYPRWFVRRFCSSLGLGLLITAQK